MLFANSLYNPLGANMAGYALTLLFISLLVTYQLLETNQRAQHSRIILIPYLLVLLVVFLFTIGRSFGL